ncbi:4-alpha-glucanotransferase [Thiohalorhabdus sp.]|uniref:4-alpha-glucanotransferase n=1 Tax=Thiohalorhabdus sp. TaxID=3094134 RepID=UPI002FC37A7F
MSSDDSRADPLARRRAGILLHPTSLPGGPGNGDLGPDAFRFVDFLADSGFSVWQTLPLGPTHDEGSPYHSLSAHAGNRTLIDPRALREAGWLDNIPTLGQVESTEAYRLDLVERAHRGFRERGGEGDWQDFEAFCQEHASWLEDYALFMALRGELGGPWWQWPEAVRDRHVTALGAARDRLAGAIAHHRFAQWVVFRQWQGIRAYANDRGILLFGDIPIFVAHDSAEVWAHREYFALDESGQPETVAGVPPDYFSETGQWWGNPHFRWERLATDGYGWWIDRIRTQLELFDWIRLDHFRGFQAFWEIPYHGEATEGRWVAGPGADFLEAVADAFGELPLVAEDLGVITPEVTELRERFGLPGMKVLQFAFGDDSTNPFLPHNHGRDFVAYTGTHDNNTTRGWWEEELTQAQREQVLDYLGLPGEAIPWPLIRAALASVAHCAILPMQDCLGLDGDHRMNQPATIEGNWQWRFQWDWLDPDLAHGLRHLNDLYGRTRQLGLDWAG